MDTPHGGVGLAERDFNARRGQVHTKVETAYAVTEQKQAHPMAARHSGSADPIDSGGIADIPVAGKHHRHVHGAGEDPGFGGAPATGLGETTIGEGGPTGDGLGEGVGLSTGLGSCVGDGAGGVQFGVVPARM